MAKRDRLNTFMTPQPLMIRGIQSVQASRVSCYSTNLEFCQKVKRKD